MRETGYEDKHCIPCTEPGQDIDLSHTISHSHYSRKDIMDWKDFRVNQRLNNVEPAQIENMYALIAEIDAVKKSWFLTKRLSPQAIERLTHSVIVTST